MTTRYLRKSIRILVINPNSSLSMTQGMEEAINGITVSDNTEIYTYTASAEAPASINSDKDVAHSCEVVYKSLATSGELRNYDAVLVACYSVHPLVQRLAHEQGSQGLLSVTGIFEASILSSLSLLTTPLSASGTPRTWGIVTTGKSWEAHLMAGVKAFLGQEVGAANFKFAGVETTGLDASDFHGAVDPAIIRTRLSDATRRLLGTGAVEAVVMGCAGMAGLEEIIRSAAIEKYGIEAGNRVFIIDGVKAGIGLLEQMVRNKRIFQK